MLKRPIASTQGEREGHQETQTGFSGMPFAQYSWNILVLHAQTAIHELFMQLLQSEVLVCDAL